MVAIFWYDFGRNFVILVNMLQKKKHWNVNIIIFYVFLIVQLCKSKLYKILILSRNNKPKLEVHYELDLAVGIVAPRYFSCLNKFFLILFLAVGQNLDQFFHLNWFQTG